MLFSCTLPGDVAAPVFAVRPEALGQISGLVCSAAISATAQGRGNVCTVLAQAARPGRAGPVTTPPRVARAGSHRVYADHAAGCIAPLLLHADGSTTTCPAVSGKVRMPFHARTDDVASLAKSRLLCDAPAQGPALLVDYGTPTCWAAQDASFTIMLASAMQDVRSVSLCGEVVCVRTGSGAVVLWRMSTVSER